MVDVRVRDDDMLHLQVVFADDGEYVVDVVAGVDDHRFTRSLVANNRAVALQRADGKNLVDHIGIVPSTELQVSNAEKIIAAIHKDFTDRTPQSGR